MKVTTCPDMAKLRSRFGACLALTCALAFGALLPHPADAQSFPSRRITVITGTTPGTLTDLVTRLMAKQLEDRFKQPVVVENRPGAGGLIAIQAAARSAPDGHTLVLGSEATLYPEVFNKEQSSPAREVTLIAAFGSTPTIFAVPASLKVRTMKELIQLARENPGKFNAAIGANTTLALEMTSFLRKNNLNMLEVPYVGMAQAIQAMATGDTQFMIASVLAVKPLLDRGTAIALGTSGANRFSLMPDIPTMKEQGFDVDYVTWFGVFSPNGMPADIVARLRREINESMNSAESIPTMAKFGAEPLTSSPEALMAKVSENSRRYREIAAQADKK